MATTEPYDGEYVERGSNVIGIHRAVFAFLLATGLASSAWAQASGVDWDLIRREGIDQIDLSACYLTANFFNESDASRLKAEGWLPPAYTPAGPVPGAAYLAIWIFDCSSVSLDGYPVGSAIISLVGITIEDRLPYPVGPINWDHYLLWLHTDNNKVANALLASGDYPVSYVSRSLFSFRPDGATTTVSIPWNESPYDIRVRGQVSDAPHVHDNTFQIGANPGREGLHLMIEPLVPNDRFCVVATNPTCASVNSAPGSLMTRFLGASMPLFAVDHELISSATLLVIVNP